MATTISARQALTAQGWRENVTVSIGDDGRIADVAGEDTRVDHTVGVLLPGLSNVHSHSFQRAMAGLAEQRGPSTKDDFWTWREVMYRFLELLTPDDVEAIAAQVQMEMLEAGYSAQAEFHYLHHAPGGGTYDQLDEMSQRHFSAADLTGIGYTHLPVLYMRGGLDGRALAGGQLRFGCDIDRFETLYSELAARLTDLPPDFTLGVAPHSLRAVSRDGLDAALALAPDGPIHIHAAEQVGEVREVKGALGAMPVEWLLANMPVDQRWCFIHATQMEPSETIGLARSGAVAGLCPLTEANLGDGIFDGSRFLKHGGRIGIGSDSNIRIAVAEELRTLETTQRLRDKQRVVLTSDAAPSNGRALYERVAVGGAQAIGRNSGRIEAGAWADLTALDDSSHMLAALEGDTMLDTWIFAGDDSLVCDVWSAGRHVVTNGQHVRRDAIVARFTETMIRLRHAL
ncbi:formimidoylglutamate deiminase [Pontixanthobacter aestiaquae]|uniref:Formimidoylglutamate deiminase n=1 Tax=Pontixanthobacter aestiaquae TaxID=1509367 RepID=A0A844Z946_9SPHN|nr:formimidoylglutamate deiminase [Pontixanthobacter aestiaquae]MDN3646596.1 formimidoylglutamate deiminase [Pontixanthobacter aestiaquae]MXO82419.1 formimidoylglutamate deiminase [Pontixanthobacter aestiaquae]